MHYPAYSHPVCHLHHPRQWNARPILCQSQGGEQLITPTLDHDPVHLLPAYRPLVHREPVITRTVRRWSEETEEVLRDCFETVWKKLFDPHGEDIYSLTNCIMDYIYICVENTVPTVWYFSNNKPWIYPDVKVLLKEKNGAFKSRNKEELKVVQRELEWKIRVGKNIYRRQK